MNCKPFASIPGLKSGAFLWLVNLLVVLAAILILGTLTGAHAALVSAPTLTAIFPTEAYNLGPTTITITGTGFFAVTGTVLIVPQVALNNTSLPNVTFVSSTTLTATVPANLPGGVYTVTVVNPDSQSGSLPNAFTVISGDGNLGTWQATTDMTMPREGLAAVVVGNYIYATGGRNSNGVLNTVERATINPDGSLGPWQTMTSLTTPRYRTAAVATGGYIYVLGGWGGGELSSVERAAINADGSLGLWEAVLPMTTPRGELAAVTATDYLYALGGTNSHGSVERAAINADGSLGPWQTAASMTIDGGGLAAVVAGGHIYALGGPCCGNKKVERAAINPDGSLGSWQVVTALTTGRGGLAAVAPGGYLYALGGWGDGGELGSIERAAINPDGSLGLWQMIATMTTGRYSLAAVVANGYLYALGGQSGGYLSSVERADINPPSLIGFSPSAVTSDQTTSVTVSGRNFMPTPSLRLGDSTTLTTTFGSLTALTATVPGGLAIGWYTATLTSGDGRTATLTNAVRVDGPGPVVVGDYGLTINDGALFTNKIAVTLTIGSRSDTALMQVSNDGGFAGVQWETYTSHKTWQITQYGNYVIPRVVYVRYKDINGNMSATFQDDIILDVTAPTGTVQVIIPTWGSNLHIESAETPVMHPVSISGFDSYSYTVYLPLVMNSFCTPPTYPANATLHLNAQDDVSGVGNMMISNEASFSCARWETYATTKAWYVPYGATTTVYVKFRDNAGNVSEVATDTITMPAQ